jgi:hypothetical protein
MYKPSPHGASDYLPVPRLECRICLDHLLFPNAAVRHLIILIIQAAAKWIENPGGLP